ncbi:hypothetical protein L1D54_19125 [Vibrio brasiliensis]|jgi:hypothetical protein|uniref:hypothetical protein n=1 Tax=Vibrio brasiliensis TaxID=170652 RepID=UPI001EFDB98E|nr:hypothetical protein [Vibrio brasiliensis]MCG9752572.1 hypothetical protein [Vibrio brasiliensis]MCG9782250.1 hypothetical protein [Vibrio brasiliensis]
MKTIICRSVQSFIDLCDNNLVEGDSVHCTFIIKQDETKWMFDYFAEKGGVNLTFTNQSNFRVLFS